MTINPPFCFMKRNIIKDIIVSSLFFVSAFSINAFASLSVEDYKQMEIEGVEPTYNQITQDETSYENWVSYIDSKTDSHYNMPSFSDVAILTENLLAYSVGNYADVASGVFDNLADTFSLGSDIWDFMTFNVQQMAFDYAPDFVEMMKSGVDDEIYIFPTGGTVGNWVSLPVGIAVSGSSSVAAICENSSGSDIYMCRVGNNYLIAFRGSGVQSMKITDKPSNYVHYIPFGQGSNGSAYTGTKYSGYYYPNSGLYPIQPSVTAYASNSVALSDFFGLEIDHGEPTLEYGIIVNDNPVINPVSLTSALGYPFKQTVINNYNNGTPIPWRPNNYNYVDYNYNYDVPFWEGQELETLVYPQEMEFPSLEFETIEVDENVDTAIESLNGSWIVEFLLIAILLLIVGLIL